MTDFGSAFAQRTAFAQHKPEGLPGNYPNKPIRAIVASSPGGGTDIAGRMVLTRLAARWNHPVVIEALRDLARWLYRQLEREYEYLSSDEAVDETITANQYTFTETGRRFG